METNILLDPKTANGAMYGGQSLLSGEVLLSHSQTVWAALLANQSSCVSQGKDAGQGVTWCSPVAKPASRLTMQGDGNL